MYTPAHFRIDDAALIGAFMRQFDFAAIVTQSPAGLVASHVPVIVTGEGDSLQIVGHLARANDHWQLMDGKTESMAIFSGPHAYISPSWYVSTGTTVPTWNYAVVHVRGRARIVTDRAATLATLQHMVARFEGGRAAPWRLQLEGARLDAMVGAIVAFEMEIERIDAKFKLSQNRDEADRRRVASALRSEAYADATATADWMDREAGSE